MHLGADNAPDPDEDVIAEADRVENDEAAQDEPIRMLGLRKAFGAKVAVHNLTFGVPKGQVFGFLGVNGAGKTTSLKMLTADILPTAGEAYLLGNDIATSQRSIRQSLGYCPQFDALIDNLTAREHLTMYCRIKGVEEGTVAGYVEALMKRIGLAEWADKLAVTYSGGTKRKLSLAMALVGDPEVVFLDEPSSGMDPGSRRFMWDLIVGSMRNRSVILTTHSMDEATALCARIGIMVNGQLRCIGSVQHLRHRYGSGYQIDVNVPGEDKKIERLQKFIHKHFEDAEMIEQHGGSMKFRVGRKGNNLSSVFRLVEDNKKKLGIAEYSVSETTLEQIFNAFAKQQQEDTRDSP